MSEFTGQVARVTDDPDADRACLLAVLGVYERGQCTAPEALDVLEMLGLREYEPGRETGALGRLESTTRMDRRRAAKGRGLTDGAGTAAGPGDGDLGPVAGTSGDFGGAA